MQHKRVARTLPKPQQGLDVSAFGGLPLHALVALDAAARLGSFALAAEELCVTRSAVSHRIRQLETRLGATLFERVGTRARLLPAGQRLLDPIAAALAALREATAALDQTERKVVRVAVPKALGTTWLVPHLGGFQQEHPDIRLEVLPVTGGDDTALDGVDVIVNVGAASRGGHALPVALVVVGAPALLAARGPIDSPDALEAWVLLGHPRFAWSEWAGQAFGCAVDPPTTFYFDDTVAMLEAAAGGLGLALAPNVACAPYLAERRLVQAHATVVANLTCGAVVSTAGAVKPAARALADWLERCLRTDARAGLGSGGG